MAVSLYEAMRTRYVANSLQYAFTKVLEDCVKSGESLDFAMCKLGPICSFTLRNYYGKIEMFNSSSPELDAILKNNTAAALAKLNEEKYREISLNFINDFNDVKDLILTINKGEKIALPSLGSNVKIAAAVFLIMTRPDLEIDIEKCNMDIYQFVHDAWVVKRQPHDKYTQFLQPDLKVMNCVNGKVNLLGVGILDEDLFVDTQKVLPYDFGSIPLIQIGTGVLPEWSEVLKKVAKTFEVAGRSKRSIMDKLQFAAPE